MGEKVLARSVVRIVRWRRATDPMNDAGKPTIDWNGTLFFSWPGMRVVEAQGGRSRVELEVKDHHRGGGHSESRTVNGGIVSYMFDGLLGAAVASGWADDINGQVTVALNIRYLDAIEAEERIYGTARVVRSGGVLAFAEGEIFDEAGKLCAVCSGIYRVFKG